MSVVAKKRTEAGKPLRHSLTWRAQQVFVRVGVLPLLLAIAVVTFGLISENFLRTENLINVARQTTYLTMVAMGQMLALLTGGFDLSVGTIIAFTSVFGALVMAGMYAAFPDSIALVIVVGMAAGFGAGLLIGIVNGLGIALFNVSPFMMTLGMASVGFGIALSMTGGVPVYGMPDAYGALFGFGSWLGIPAPVYVTVALILVMYFVLNWTRMGRYFYAIGGNRRAAELSGISTRWYLFMAYVLCGALATVAGLMLTARLETGEANIGASMPLESIAACVIGGVSLRGGTGRLGNVVLGTIFIGLIQNGMNLAQIQSYLQIVVIGVLLIVAVIADNVRQHLVARLQD
jgi:ribose/xylose/arabinose/galactoside ABC-type transport system permease subunit